MLHTGDRLNIRMRCYEYCDSHCKDKMVSRPSYVYIGNSHIWGLVFILKRGPSGALLCLLWYGSCRFFQMFLSSMMTSSNGNISALLALCVANSPVPTKASDAELWYYKRLSKQSGGWWFETPSRLLWRHCNVFQRCNAVCELHLVTPYMSYVPPDGLVISNHHSDREYIPYGWYFPIMSCCKW